MDDWVLDATPLEAPEKALKVLRSKVGFSQEEDRSRPGGDLVYHAFKAVERSHDAVISEQQRLSLPYRRKASRSIARRLLDPQLVHPLGHAVGGAEVAEVDLTDLRDAAALLTQAGNVVVILLKAGMCRSEHFAKVITVWPEGNGTWIVGCGRRATAPIRILTTA